VAKKTFIDSLKDMVVGGKGPARKARKSPASQSRARARARARDKLSPFTVSYLDVDRLLDAGPDELRSIPNELKQGTVLLSQQMGIKCLLLQALEEVGRKKLRDICARKLSEEEAAYLPMGTQILREEILHQGRDFTVRLPRGTLFLNPGGHPDGYLLEQLDLPLRRETDAISQILPINENTAPKYLQTLVDVPPSFALIKEDIFYDEQARDTIEKGSLTISRSGGLTGIMLDDVQLPISGSISNLDELFPLKATYQRFPIETLVQQAAKSRESEIAIERGTFLFTPFGKIYFVWKDGLKASEKQLSLWAKQSYINDPAILEVTLHRSNRIGGPGVVITQEEINYLRDVFRQAGTTNILNETLVLDRNIFYKLVFDMPYAQSGKFRSYLGKGVIILNTFRKGTFSVEMGGKDIEISDLDLLMVRKHLQAEGRILIKIGSHLRIRDPRQGDWVYRVVTNLFYPYETFSRPYLEEFVPENIVLDHRAEKASTLIGPQDNPADEDIGAAGEPVSDLIALINNELFQKERSVFVLDGTLFHWRGRLFRVNEELAYLTHAVSDKLQSLDLEALESDWKIHPVVEEAEDEEEGIPPDLEEDEDLDDLPFDTATRS